MMMLFLQIPFHMKPFLYSGLFISKSYRSQIKESLTKSWQVDFHFIFSLIVVYSYCLFYYIFSFSSFFVESLIGVQNIEYC